MFHPKDKILECSDSREDVSLETMLPLCPRACMVMKILYSKNSPERKGCDLQASQVVLKCAHTWAGETANRTKSLKPLSPPS